MHYDHEKIKDLIIAHPDDPEPDLPTVYAPGNHLRTIETDADTLEDSAIEVASTIMATQADTDPKLALDAAKATMSWLGRGAKARTTVFANNAQINNLPDPDSSKHILDSLRDSIGLITEGTKIEEEK